jgi:hypothetical protein
MIILFRLVRGDIMFVKSMLLLCKRNSIPPVALPVGDVSLLGRISLTFGAM